MHCIGDTVTNDKADAKSPSPVIFTASRRQSFCCPKSTSSCQSVIFFTSQSHFFTWLTPGLLWTNVDEIVYIYLWPVKPWPKKLNWLMFKNNLCLTRFLVQKTMDFPEIWIVSVISWTCERIVIFFGWILDSHLDKKSVRDWEWSRPQSKSWIWINANHWIMMLNFDNFFGCTAVEMRKT